MATTLMTRLQEVTFPGQEIVLHIPLKNLNVLFHTLVFVWIKQSGSQILFEQRQARCFLLFTAFMLSCNIQLLGPATLLGHIWQTEMIMFRNITQMRVFPTVFCNCLSVKSRCSSATTGGLRGGQKGQLPPLPVP